MRSRHLSTLLPALALACSALPAATAYADPIYDACRTAQGLLVTPVHVCENGIGRALQNVIDVVVGPPTVEYPLYAVILRNVVVGGSSAAPRASVPDVKALQAERMGADIEYVYRHALRGYAARMSPAVRDAVAADPDVSYVHEAVWGGIAVTQNNPPWGLDRIDQHNLPLSTTYSYTTNGAGITAYVLDSGIRYTHLDFGGRAVPGFDASNTPNGNVDCNGHGTHVAGTIGGATYGVAKAVSLVSVRVVNCGGFGNDLEAAAGVDWVTGAHPPGQPAVANMSLQYGFSATLNTAVQNSILDGIVYSVAATNYNGDACTFSPASTPEAMTIASANNTDTRAGTSGWGPCVDWFAPGVNIPSAWNTNDTATNTISGTSMATPHNSGAAARYLQVDPTASQATVAAFLQNRTTKNVVVNANGAPPDMLYMSMPVTLPAYGHITIRKKTTDLSPSFVTTGVYLTDFSCSLYNTPTRVECTPLPNPDVTWDCTYFINTATAPAPGDVGAGTVAARIACNSDDMATPPVVGAGIQQADNALLNITLGEANPAICYAEGATGPGSSASGSYEADCWEPGARHPFDTA